MVKSDGRGGGGAGHRHVPPVGKCQIEQVEAVNYCTLNTLLGQCIDVAPYNSPVYCG